MTAEVFEEKYETAIGFVEFRDIGARHSHGDIARERLVEERFSPAHACIKNRLSPLRIDGKHLEKEGFWEPAGLGITNADARIRIRSVMNF